MTSQQRLSAERRALELLPWYVNGTLAGEERELVRRQLSTSLTCRKEFERLRRLQRSMQALDDEAVADDRAFERLMARIDRAPRSRGVHLGSLRRAARWSQLGRAAVILVFASGLAWWWLGSRPPAPQTYQTLSTPQLLDRGVTALRVVFAPGLSEAALRELLVEHGLTIIDGPTRNGIYTLALADSADAESIVAALEADPRVEFTSVSATAEE